MPHRPSRRAWLVNNSVKLTALAAIVAAGTFTSHTTTSAWPEPSYAGPQGYVGQSVAHDSVRTAKLLDRHSCSTSGFDTEQQPLSAIVRSASGKPRFVDFDTGWEIYTARGAATLVAVCLDEPPA